VRGVTKPLDAPHPDFHFFRLESNPLVFFAAGEAEVCRI
jgi:hypothetical protein